MNYETEIYIIRPEVYYMYIKLSWVKYGWTILHQYKGMFISFDEKMKLNMH
jgi:hypothetical protein